MFLGQKNIEQIKKEKQERVKQDNAVVINIWPSEDNKYIKGHNVGHISITLPQRFLNVVEEKSNYVSLWPQAGTKTTLIERRIQNYISGRGAHFMVSYDDDVETEGACEEMDRLEAGVRIVLYSLDTDKMFQCFEMLKNTTKGWRMIGSNWLTQVLNENGHALESCASFALRVLKVGGFYSEMTSMKSTSMSSNVSSIVTPDEMVEQVILVKQREQELYPQTKQWHCNFESSIDDLIEAYEKHSEEKSGCFIA